MYNARPIEKLTVTDVVDVLALHLEVIAGHKQLGNEVTGALVSELTSPKAWLRGGELLMTVGLLLPMTVADCRRYLTECADAGVAGVALGLGPGLPYQECPQPLREAANDARLPVLMVPGDVPFIAVTKWVFGALAEREHAELQTAMEINQRLTAVATSAAPLSALLATWGDISDSPCIVCDSGGRLIGASPGAEPELVDRACRIPFEKPAAAQSGWTVRGDFEIHTVGNKVPLAYIVLGAQMDNTSRHSSTVLVSLIALEAQRRDLSDQPERQRRTHVFSQLLRPGIKRERASHLAASVGMSARRYEVAAINADAETLEPLVFRLSSALPSAFLRLQDKIVEMAHPDPSALRNTLRTRAAGLPIGIGAPTAPETLSISAMQARSLLPVSIRLGRIVDAREGETVSFLLSLGTPELLRAFADAVLAPLDQLETPERLELQRTLEQWLRANGAWGPAAAQLSVHRNTVRNRIDKVAQLTGRRLDEGDDRMELWLALKARAAAVS
jgi:Purine catabolism regulatory protein-like family/PucR C-terminal helix-turn-helix domain